MATILQPTIKKTTPTPVNTVAPTPIPKAGMAVNMSAAPAAKLNTMAKAPVGLTPAAALNTMAKPTVKAIAPTIGKGGGSVAPNVGPGGTNPAVKPTVAPVKLPANVGPVVKPTAAPVKPPINVGPGGTNPAAKPVTTPAKPLTADELYAQGVKGQADAAFNEESVAAKSANAEELAGYEQQSKQLNDQYNEFIASGETQKASEIKALQRATERDMQRRGFDTSTVGTALNAEGSADITNTYAAAALNKKRETDTQLAGISSQKTLATKKLNDTINAKLATKNATVTADINKYKADLLKTKDEQAFEEKMTKLGFTHDESMQLMQNAQEDKTLKSTQEFSAKSQQAGFAQDDKTLKATQTFDAKMQAAGFTQDQILKKLDYAQQDKTGKTQREFDAAMQKAGFTQDEIMQAKQFAQQIKLQQMSKSGSGGSGGSSKPSPTPPPVPPPPPPPPPKKQGSGGGGGGGRPQKMIL